MRTVKRDGGVATLVPGAARSVLIYDATGRPATLTGGANNGPVIFDAAGNPVVLARGADAQVLTLPVGGGPPAWATPAPTPSGGTSGQLLQSAGAAASVWAGDTTWTAIAGGVGFQNSWVDNGGGFQAASFIKDASGRVYVQGFIKSGVIGSTAFTLPIGYRPTAAHRYATESNGHGVVQIDTAGNVLPLTGLNAAFMVEFNFSTF